MTNKKQTNPKDALSDKKAPLSAIPLAPIYEAGLGMLEGGRKYGRHNYRVMGVRASVYYDAAKGHIDSWWEGEDIDPESGIHHLAKAIASLLVLRDGQFMKNWIDDRPPRYPDEISKLLRRNPLVAGVLERLPKCVPAYTEKNKDLPRDDDGQFIEMDEH